MQYLNLDIEIQKADNPDSPREHRVYPLTASLSNHPFHSLVPKIYICSNYPIRLKISEADLEGKLNMVQYGIYTTDAEYLAPQLTAILEPNPSENAQPLSQISTQPLNLSLQIQDFGAELFRTLFGGPDSPLYKAYAKTLHNVKQRKARCLRIRLSIRADDLSLLPWELLYDPFPLQDQGEPGYLCRNPSISLVRSLDLKHHIPSTPIKLPLSVCNILALSDKEWEAIQEMKLETGVLEIFDNLKSKAKISQFDVKREQRLREILKNSNDHIFHFFGHGGFDEVHKEGFLKFADGNHMLASDLSIGHSSQNFHLAVFNTCEGARGDASDRFSSTAAKLVQRGTPAVVAMQYKITYSASLTFAQAFYNDVSKNGDIDSAVIAARRAITAQPSSLEWASPVLYLKSDSGQLFKISKSQAYIKQIQAFPRN